MLDPARLRVAIGPAITCTHEISTFTLLLWDSALTAGQEYRVIWRQPCPAIVKWAYLAARYPVLIAGLLNIFFVWKYLSQVPFPIPSETCRGYFFFQLVMFRWALCLTDLSFSLKVWELYSRGRRRFVTRLLICNMVSSIVIAIITGEAIRRETRFDSVCLPYDIPVKSMSISVITSLSRGSAMTYFIARKRSGRGHIPFFSHFAQFDERTGLMLVLGCAGVFAALFPYRSTFPSTGQAFWLWRTTFATVLSSRISLYINNGEENHPTRDQ